MFLEKFAKDDELFFHKAGLILGTIVGVALGFVVSDRADRYKVEEIEEEAPVNGSEEA